MSRYRDPQPQVSKNYLHTYKLNQVFNLENSIFPAYFLVWRTRLKSAIEAMSILRFNPYPVQLISLNFQPLEFVCRYRDPQPQVVENYT